MPDDWETGKGLNPLDPADRNGDIDGDGYTNLEDYLNNIEITTRYTNYPGDNLSFTVFPNPVISEATIQFYLQVPSRVRVNILDITGRVIENILDTILDEGYQRMAWSPVRSIRCNAGGIFLCRLDTDNFTAYQKILIL